MLAIFKRGRRWWTRGHVRGQLIRRSLDTQFKNEALQRVQELERELFSGRRVRPVAWPDFQKEFVAAIRHSVKPSTLRKYEFVAEKFGASLARHGVPGVQAITTSTISAYLAERGLGAPASGRHSPTAEGLKSDQRILHRILAYAIQAGYLEKNPVVYKNLSSQSRNTQPFSREEVARMFAAAGKITSPVPNATPPRADLPAILLTFLSTGLRISDVCGLEKRDLNFPERMILRRTLKRGKLVAIPMHKELVAALQKHLADTRHLTPDTRFVFPTASGRMTLPETMDAILRRLWRRAGIVGAHAHRFRDTFSVRLLAQRASLYDVAQLLGITVAVCEKHYAPWVPEHQDRVQKLIAGMPIPGPLITDAANRGTISP